LAFVHIHSIPELVVVKELEGGEGTGDSDSLTPHAAQFVAVIVGEASLWVEVFHQDEGDPTIAPAELPPPAELTTQPMMMNRKAPWSTCRLTTSTHSVDNDELNEEAMAILQSRIAQSTCCGYDRLNIHMIRILHDNCVSIPNITNPDLMAQLAVVDEEDKLHRKRSSKSSKQCNANKENIISFIDCIHQHNPATFPTLIHLPSMPLLPY
jgi:hypothetical protein